MHVWRCRKLEAEQLQGRSFECVERLHGLEHVSVHLTGLRCASPQVIVGEDLRQRMSDINLRIETVDDLPKSRLFQLQTVQKLLDMGRKDQLRDASGDGMSRKAAPTEMNRKT